MHVFLSSDIVTSAFNEDMLDNEEDWCEDFNDQTISGSYLGNCNGVAKYLTFVTNNQRIRIEKIVITGYSLDEYPVQVTSNNFGDDDYEDYCYEITAAN